ncbi:MAG: hypothetical protein JEZ14_02690 [Marinilabiliaceae bacterium]|nr:hypothetical protein [Marinilabiliaceae bacterium]
MNAGIFFTGTGPILILTSYDSLTNPDFVTKLSVKGIKKFIAFEVSEAVIKEKYGQHFKLVMGDLYQTDDIRILDYDGHRVFYNFSLKELGDPIYYES